MAELMERIQSAEESVQWWSFVNVHSNKPSCSIVRGNTLAIYLAVNV